MCWELGHAQLAISDGTAFLSAVGTRLHAKEPFQVPLQKEAQSMLINASTALWM